MKRKHIAARIQRPTLLLHGGGGANTPADRETRYAPYDNSRENRNDYLIP